MKKGITTKKGVSGLLAVLMVMSVFLAACGDKGAEDQSGQTYDPKSKLEFTWLNVLHTASPPTETIKSKIEEYTNSKITFNWVPDASKEERITTALASGELADMVTLTMMTNSSVRSSLKSGLFWDVGKYLDDYENLKKIPPEVREAASIEGVLYGVPFQKNLARAGLVIRQDWLDRLGLKVPTTLDELYEVARAFTEDDPDGNGKNDTTGFVDRSDLRYSSFKTLSSYFGTPNGWKVDESGKFTPEFDTPQYLETLKYSNKLYKNGYLSKDFAVTAKTDQQQQFAQGKAGIYTGMIDISNLRTLSQGLQKGLKLVPVNKISNGDGKYHVWSEGSGVGGLLAFPKSEVKTEAELKRLLQFVDDLIDKDVYMYMTGGIEGTHYKIEKDGAFKITNTDLWQADVQPFSSSRPSEVTYNLKDANPEKELANELVRENNEFAVLDPTVPLDSVTANEQGTELEKIITDASFKFIMGELDEAGFKAAVENWKNSGGSRITAEYEEAYKKTKK
ncbi:MULTISPECIES: extracellular solute-binding protein [Paenibacillus]|jgi:putative aldouronate transport system substrate-binding protein|uniref:Extracellular solute-binding protein n=2 Tax=Paenibacillus TaxID=44249 RepID=A0A0M1Q963_PAEPO|nr:MULTISPECIES: extracellular solute-binding protein [Paenibacillus]MCF2719810.1 extracellular solute-binding protein [Paenibacillus sp. UKAQ_18]ALA43025.1 sugar ABC transporter substrate-binding protein [Paenibacillus peoriae]AOK88997.1 sugar ABC transporter substrate-binding protein [Paenibacillus polymyxa]APB70520.1 sugar ABC transporter substrate-binding protein [Paenibacillus polymyxa]APQ60287.1 sugar ABC transporter substrate-binding protein [Paenibacillus polymyxa]